MELYVVSKHKLPSYFCSFRWISQTGKLSDYWWWMAALFTLPISLFKLYDHCKLNT
jgi:hypothetical protein